MGSAIVWIKAKELKYEFFAIKKGNSKAKFVSYLKSGQISIAGIFFYRTLRYESSFVFLCRFFTVYSHQKVTG